MAPRPWNTLGDQAGATRCSDAVRETGRRPGTGVAKAIDLLWQSFFPARLVHGRDWNCGLAARGNRIRNWKGAPVTPVEPGAGARATLEVLLPRKRPGVTCRRPRLDTLYWPSPST